MKTWIKIPVLYLLLLIFFAVFDFLWLGILANDFYFSRLESVVNVEVSIPYALVFYFVYPVFLGVLSGLFYSNTFSWNVIGKAALFGAATYATYDLTNLAVIPNWPLDMAIIDILWGTVLCAGTTALTSWTYFLFPSKK